MKFTKPTIIAAVAIVTLATGGAVAASQMNDVQVTPGPAIRQTTQDQLQAKPAEPVTKAADTDNLTTPDTQTSNSDSTPLANETQTEAAQNEAPANDTPTPEVTAPAVETNPTNVSNDNNSSAGASNDNGSGVTHN